MPKKKSINPFYVLLLVAGTAFAITAMAFGVMTVRGLQASRMADYDPTAPGYSSTFGEPTPFDEFMDRNGTQLLIGELVLLTIGTFGAIFYDQHLDRKSGNRIEQPQESESQS